MARFETDIDKSSIRNYKLSVQQEWVRLGLLNHIGFSGRVSEEKAVCESPPHNSVLNALHSRSKASWLLFHRWVSKSRALELSSHQIVHSARASFVYVCQTS